MKKKPIRVVWNPVTARFYATAQWRMGKDGILLVTGDLFDVTDDIGYAIERHGIEFNKVEESKGTLKVTAI